MQVFNQSLNSIPLPPPESYAAQNGVGLTPAMGWSSWDAFGCDNLNEEAIDSQMSALKDKFQDVGYEYLIIDDCWMEAERHYTSSLMYDEDKFPDGIQKLADETHEMGMKFGIYASAGTSTCARKAGSLGFEDSDANDWVRTGIDYLKYDNCHNEGIPAQERYGAMSKALLKNVDHRPVYYSIVNWGNEDVTSWGYTQANSWRTTPDLMIGGGALNSNVWQNLKGNFLKNQLSASNARVGGWNDLDLLVVGNNILTLGEEKTHFALWAFAKSPLIMSADLTKISDESMAVLTNKHLIEINQDKLGKQAMSPSGNVADNFYQVQGIHPTDGPYLAVLVVNWGDDVQTIQYDPVLHGAAFSKYDTCMYTDLQTGKKTTSNGDIRSFENVPAHEHVAFRSQCSPF